MELCEGVRNLDSVICIFDVNGKKMTATEYEQMKRDMKNEIIQVLKKYNLTVGQTQNILGECESDIRNAMYELSFVEHFKSI